jgi:hypothetical protein
MQSSSCFRSVSALRVIPVHFSGETEMAKASAECGSGDLYFFAYQQGLRECNGDVTLPGQVLEWWDQSIG